MTNVTELRPAKNNLEGLIYDVYRAAELAERLVIDEGMVERDLVQFAVRQCNSLDCCDANPRRRWARAYLPRKGEKDVAEGFSCPCR